MNNAEDIKDVPITDKGYTVQCIDCLKILGISKRDFQREEIYCYKCISELLERKKESTDDKIGELIDDAFQSGGDKSGK